MGYICIRTDVEVSTYDLARDMSKSDLDDLIKEMGDKAKGRKETPIDETARSLVDALTTYLGTENVEADSIERFNVFRALEDMREALR